MSDLKIEIKQRCQWTTKTMNKCNNSWSIRVMKNCAGPLNLHLFFIFSFCCLVLVFKIGFIRLLRYCQLCYCYCLCFLLSFIIIYIFIWTAHLKRQAFGHSKFIVFYILCQWLETYRKSKFYSKGFTHRTNPEMTMILQ